MYIGIDNPPAAYKWMKTAQVFFNCNEKKVCEYLFPTGLFVGWIAIHSFEWIKNKVNQEREQNGLSPLSDECINCLIDCLIEHEVTHMLLAKGIVKGCWDEFLGKLIPTSVRCCKECKDKSLEFILEFYSCVDNGIRNTENDARSAQKNCENKNCSTLCQ